MLNAPLWHPYTILCSIDMRVPKPFMWEDWEGNRVLYIVVLDSKKEEAMKSFFDENPTVAVLRSPFTSFDLDDALYCPQSYVEWQAGTNPTCVFRE